MSAAATAEPVERTVKHPDGVLHIVDRSGEEPAIVLMHGFPDDHHIYDRLLQKVVLVGHDASGPEAIEFALRSPAQVAQLVLLNTYYGRCQGLRFPEMIRLFADPQLAPLADAMVDDPQQRLWLLTHSAKQFGMYPLKPDGIAATSIVAQYFGSEQQPDALGEIRAWTADLFGALAAQDERIAQGHLRRLATRATLIFGRRDTYLSVNVARRLAELVGTSDVHPIEGASQWPQWDEPQTVASILGGGAVRVVTPNPHHESETMGQDDLISAADCRLEAR